MKGTAPSAAFNTTGVAKYSDFGLIEGYSSSSSSRNEYYLGGTIALLYLGNSARYEVS